MGGGNQIQGSRPLSLLMEKNLPQLLRCYLPALFIMTYFVVLTENTAKITARKENCPSPFASFRASYGWLLPGVQADLGYSGQGSPATGSRLFIAVHTTAAGAQPAVAKQIPCLQAITSLSA